MGVTGTFCQLCALPVQHDHYVPANGGYLNIYRGGTEGGGRDWSAETHKPFPFDERHRWLEDAVSVNRFSTGTKRGRVEDGHLRSSPDDDDPAFVWNGGDEDGFVFHHWCWEAIGKPERGEDTIRAAGLLPYSFVAIYHGQLFELRELATDGKGWMTEDPRTSARSRERIEGLIELAKAHPMSGEATSLQEIVQADRDWVAVTGHDDDDARSSLVHFRSAPNPNTPGLSNFPHLLCLSLVFDQKRNLPTPEELEAFEAFALGFGAAIERDGFGVHVLTAFGQGKRQHLAYVKDLAEGHRRIDALPGRGLISPTRSAPGLNAPDDYDDAHDPRWKIVFEEMGLPRR